MSVEAKVGAFTIVGLLLFLSAAAGLQHIHLWGSKGYTLYAGFRQAVGLEPQSMVRLSGVPIGTVTDIQNDGGGVTLTLSIDPDVEIPRGSNAMIASVGVMGEKFVNITPSHDHGDYYKDGDYIFGTDETGMDSMFESMNKTLEQAQALLISMNNVIGDPEFKQSIVGMSVNMRDASEHLNGMMASLERTAVNNEGSINASIQQLPQIVASMNRTMASVEHMMANVDTVAGDPQTAENLRVTLENITETSKRVAHMAENMDKVLGDPQTAEDAKAILHNARSVSERADKMLGKISSIEVTPSVDVLYSGGAHEWTSNFNLEVAAKDGPFLNLGVDDIGERNHANVQVGKNFGAFGARGGLVAGKLGLGLDAHIGDRLKFSADAYNPNHGTLRLRTQYRLFDHTYLMGQWNDVTRRRNRVAYVGLRQEF